MTTGNNDRAALAFQLLAASNYIDALGGISTSYRQALAADPSQASVPAGWMLGQPITEAMHAAACKVLARVNGLDGTPQRMLDAMIAAAPQAHDLFKTGDADAPREVLDRNGEVVLGMCRRCGRAELELSHPCEAPAPEAPKGEPVAWQCKDFADGWILFNTQLEAAKYQECTGCLMQPLYTTPQPKRLPLTDETVGNMWTRWSMSPAEGDWHFVSETKRLAAAFKAGIRSAERAHGITGEAE